MKRLQLSGHFGIAQLHSFHTTSCDCWNSVVWRTKVGIKRLEYSRQVQGSSEGPFIFHDSLWGLLTLWGLHLPHSWIFFPTWSCIPHFFSKGVGFWTLFFGVCCTEDPSYDIRIWSSYQSFHLGPRVTRSNSVGVVSVCLGCYNKKFHRLDSLCTAEIYCSQFWGLEIQDQGASMVWWGPAFSQGTSQVLTWLQGRDLCGIFFSGL